MKLSVVIPCYNESESLRDLTYSIDKFISDEIEFILVNNGSTDDTLIEFEKLCLHKNIKIINIKKNIGYGNAIIKGLNDSRGEIVSWTHADLQTDPFDLIRGYELFKDELKTKKCIVKGRRKQRKLIDALFTFFMSIYSFLINKKWLTDINAQPKLFHRSFLKKLKNPPLDFSLDLYILYFFKLKNIKIKSFPVYFKKRKFGQAKGGGGSIKNKLMLIKRTLHYIHKLKNKNLIIHGNNNS